MDRRGASDVARIPGENVSVIDGIFVVILNKQENTMRCVPDAIAGGGSEGLFGFCGLCRPEKARGRADKRSYYL